MKKAKLPQSFNKDYFKNNKIKPRTKPRENSPIQTFQTKLRPYKAILKSQ